MEGQSHQSVFTSFPFEENAYNNLSQSAENYPYQHSIEAEGRNDSYTFHTPLPQWIHSEPMAHNYVQFLAENGHSEIQGETSYIDPCITSSFNLAGSSIGIDDQKVRYLDMLNERASPHNISTAEQQICVQAEGSKEDSPCSGKTVPLLKTRSKVSREKARSSELRRRLRIGGRLDALQELLPSKKKCGKASIYDHVIDHIKHLQLQVKDLSRSRLGGESTSYPFVSLEGHGHYLVHDKMRKESLEEIMGKLMEVNPSAAAQLLGSRGLFVMPIAFGEELNMYSQNR